MLSRVLTSIAVCAAGVAAGAAGSSPTAERWRRLYFYERLDSSLVINDFKFINAQHGIAAGFLLDKNGKIKPTSLTTDDGGLHWTLAPLKEVPISLFFLDDKQGWLVADKSIWQTQDGGRVWGKISSLDDAVRSRSRPAAVIVSVAVAFVALIGFLSYAYRRETGELLIHLGETLSGEFRPQTAAPAPPPASISPGESAPPTGAPGANAMVGGPSEIAGKSSPSDAGHAPTQTAEGQAAEAGGARAPEQSDLSKSEDNGDSELRLARKYLREPHDPANISAAVDLLWSAVQKGSEGAELDLAELYLQGEGVQKNCEQARVLLTAAAKRNNAVAEQKLSELSGDGCK